MEIRECSIGYFEWEKPNLILFTLIKEEPCIEGLKEIAELFKQIADEHQSKFVFVFDATKGKWISSEVRIAWGNIIKEIEERYANRYVRNYLIVPNISVNFMLKGVNLIVKPKVPQRIFRKVEIGLTAAKKEIASW